MNLENRTPEPPQQPSQPKKSSLPLVLGVAGVAALGLFALSRSGTGGAPQPTPVATSEVRMGASGELTAAPQNPLSDSYKEPQLLLFVPDENGEMKKRTLAPKGDIPKDPRQAQEKLATQAVQALMQAEPDLFPPSASLVGASVEGSVTSLNFSSAFAEPNFWQGSARTTAALDAIAMTALATQAQVAGTSANGSVRFLVEGKSLPALGEMDLSGPYTPSVKAPPGSTS